MNRQLIWEDPLFMIMGLFSVKTVKHLYSPRFFAIFRDLFEVFTCGHVTTLEPFESTCALSTSNCLILFLP